MDIDWDAPLVDGAWFMQPERLSLYGTPLWDADERGAARELSRHEVASIASVGLWFELILMQMMVRELYDEDPRSAAHPVRPHRDRRRVPALGDVRPGDRAARRPGVRPDPQIHRLGRGFKTSPRGASAYASILVAEEILDRWQRELMKDERVQPLIRMVSRDPRARGGAAHDVRARGGRRDAGATLSRPQLAWHRDDHRADRVMVARTLVNPQVYVAVGLDPREAKRAALANPHYRETMGWMGERVVGFLDEQGLIGRAQHATWRRSLLRR